MRSPATSSAAQTTSVTFSARNTSRPIPHPRGTVPPGARNFSGASRNEIASTIPSQVKVTAIETACAAVIWPPFSVPAGAARAISDSLHPNSSFDSCGRLILPSSLCGHGTG